VGIRIHKVMGWGLNNIVTDEKGEVIDPRIDTTFFQSEDYWEKMSNIEKFMKYLKNNKEECTNLLKTVESSPRDNSGNRGFEINIFLSLWEHSFKKHKEGKGFYNYCNNSITYEPEFGKKEILLFTPISCDNWSRSNDSIDYYEAGENMEITIKDLTDRCGIYPFIEMVHIPGSPNFGKEGYPNSMFPGHFYKLMGAFQHILPPLIDDPKLLEYFKKYYRPTIPMEVITFIKYMGIFKDFNKTIQEFRPMIYTYWA